MSRKKVLLAQALTLCMVGGMVSNVQAASAVTAEDLMELRKIIEKQQMQLNNQAAQITELKSMLSDNAEVQQAGSTPAAGSEPAEMKGVVASGGKDVQVQLYGHINRAVLGADNGDVTEAYFVDNDNSQTRVGINASTNLSEKSTVGGKLEYGVKSNASTDVNQLKTNNASSVDWNLRHADIYYSSKSAGKFSLGKGSAATDGIAEIDLSGTSVATYSDLSGMAGGILFYDDATGTLSEVQVKNVFANMDGGREDRFRYDTPGFNGFTFSGSFISGEAYDAAIRYNRKYGDTKVAAGLGWLKAGDTRSYDYQVSGSFSMLMGSGLNVTLAAGLREMDESSRDEGNFYYAKLGYQAALCELGITSIAVDFGMNENIQEDGDEAFSWSIGAVQAIPTWGTEFYLAFRQYDLDRTGTDYDAVNAILGGARVKF